MTTKELSTEAELLHKRLDNPTGMSYLGEFLIMLNKIKNRQERVDLLKKYVTIKPDNIKAITILAQLLWHPNAIMHLPMGTPPIIDHAYKDYGLAPSSLARELNKVGYYIKGTPTYVQNTVKREQIFMSSMEQLYIEELKLLIDIKDRTLPAKMKNLSESISVEAFPQQFPWLVEILAAAKAKKA